MTGRGRSRRAKSPDPDEKLNGSTGEQKVKQRERTTNHFTEESQRNDLTATVQGARAKAAFTKSQASGTKEVQPVKPKDTTRDPPKTQARKSGKQKSPEECLEKRTAKLDPPKETTKAVKKETTKAVKKETTKTVKKETTKTVKKETTKTVKATEENTCGAKTKPQKTQQPPKQKDARSDSTTSTKAKPGPGRSKSQDKRDDDSILHTTLNKLTIKKKDREKAAGVINEIKTHIIRHLRQNSQYFREVEEPLCTGSYYENVKISNPDEFDVMLPVPLERANVREFGDDGAFYSVALKRENSPLKAFQDDDVLSASKMLKAFRKEVKECVRALQHWELSKKKKGCPAVTFTTTVQSVTISLDVVLCLVVKSSWPVFTKDGLKIEAWLGSKVKTDYKRKAFYLVPKYEGRGTLANAGVLARDVWRISFSHIEKEILKNHGSEKTCCEKNGERCCRKSCLKLLKHLLSLLKEGDSSFDKFCSYHAKTTLLHACCSRSKDSEWMASNLSQCFHLLLVDFICHLEKCELHNFFIPSQNLLSGVDQKRCNSLARRIREERDNGFPMFKSQPTGSA